jgi:hypothetical protein
MRRKIEEARANARRMAAGTLAQRARNNELRVRLVAMRERIVSLGSRRETR